MCRLLLNSLCLGLALVCLATIVAWRTKPRWIYVDRSSDGVDTTTIGLVRGGLDFCSFHDEGGILASIAEALSESPPGSHPAFRILDSFQLSPQERRDFAGGFWTKTDMAPIALRRNYPSSSLICAYVPYLPIMVGTSTLPLIWVARRLSQRRQVLGTGFPVIRN
jgi:hypothetical protein